MFPTRFFNVRMFARRYWPKVGADPDPGVVTPTGAISATDVENYIGGSLTISVLGGSVTGSMPGGSIS